mmetsp:Transcript_51301/g.164023  ORF Transcript_51301/g.164023 Transcript_51301/m.164023 type:complete len:266 (-) Transcript_51301:426-1223(-)
MPPVVALGPLFGRHKHGHVPRRHDVPDHLWLHDTMQHLGVAFDHPVPVQLSPFLVLAVIVQESRLRAVLRVHVASFNRHVDQHHSHLGQDLAPPIGDFLLQGLLSMLAHELDGFAPLPHLVGCFHRRLAYREDLLGRPTNPECVVEHEVGGVEFLLLLLHRLPQALEVHLGLARLRRENCELHQLGAPGLVLAEHHSHDGVESQHSPLVARHLQQIGAVHGAVVTLYPILDVLHLLIEPRLEVRVPLHQEPAAQRHHGALAALLG